MDQSTNQNNQTEPEITETPDINTPEQETPAEASPETTKALDKNFFSHLPMVVHTSDALMIILLVASIALIGTLANTSLAIEQFNSLASLSSIKTGLAKAKTLQWHAETLSAPWKRRDSAFTYIWNDELYMAGGLDASDTFDAERKQEPVYENAIYYNDIWKTKDGKDWELVTKHSELPLMRSSSVLPFNGKLYLYNGWSPETGMNDKIYESTDGVHWKVAVEKADFIPREGQRMLVANGKVYMFGGVNYFVHKTFNDVWVSEDGIHFTEISADSPWSGRWDHDVAYLNGQFILAGGMNLNLDSFGDVWTSKDGVAWNLALEHAPWSARQGQVLITMDGVAYFVGGLDAYTNEGIGDTWVTKDGVHWEKTFVDGLWTGREDHQVIPFKGKLILFTGMDSNWQWRSDVWIGSLN